jgi:hypothetical protein
VVCTGVRSSDTMNFTGKIEQVLDLSIMSEHGYL